MVASATSNVWEKSRAEIRIKEPIERTMDFILAISKSHRGHAERAQCGAGCQPAAECQSALRRVAKDQEAGCQPAAGWQPAPHRTSSPDDTGAQRARPLVTDQNTLHAGCQLRSG